MSFWVYVLCVFIRKRKEVFFPDEIEVSMWMSAWATKSTAVVIEFLQAHTHQLRPCILDQNAWAWGASAPQKFHHQCVSWIGRCIRIDKCPNTATRARAYITYVNGYFMGCDFVAQTQTSLLLLQCLYGCVCMVWLLLLICLFASLYYTTLTFITRNFVHLFVCRLLLLLLQMWRFFFFPFFNFIAYTL